MRLPSTAFLVLPLLTPLAAAPGAPAPATLSKEGDLMTITLTADAEAKLRLKTVAIERRVVPATRLYAGEVVLAGKQTLSPLVGGTLEERLRLAEQQAVADGQVAKARAQAELSRFTVERAEKMLTAEAGSQRALDEARAALQSADAELRTARVRRELLGSGGTLAGGGDGKWVRVAVFAGEANQVAGSEPAAVRGLGAGAKPVTASPVAGPATADARAATIDLFYALPDAAPWRAGERVAVELTLSDGRADSLIVPFSAVLHDIHGGEWVYARTADRTYVRRRVEVARVAGADAVLARGPVAGTAVVTDGAAELFGTEFMTGK